VAWGYTNAYTDWLDSVIIETVASDPDLYRTPDGPRCFERHQEIIEIKGRRPDTLEVVTTIWGPVIGTDHHDRPLVLRWVAHDSEAVDGDLVWLEQTNNVTETLTWAASCGIPPLNLVCADREGHIGWTIIGAIPRRFGGDGRLPRSWADGDYGWDGYLQPAEYPRIVDPMDGILWTANNRVVSGDKLAVLGDGGYGHGARARQIRDDLLALERADEQDMLAVQLDDRAFFLQWWRDLLLDLLTTSATASHLERTEFRRLADETWTGRASVESAGYRLVRAFRYNLREEVYGWLTADCLAADPDFDSWQLPYWEGVLRSLLRERPLHLLPPRFASWDDALLAVVDSTVVEFTDENQVLAQRTWGERNTAAIRHPLSAAVPFLARWIDMPATQLPGDSYMPRVQHPRSGASQRMVVAPGRETEGIFHMPCGQSGHPFSPYFGAGHDAWEAGWPTPLRPGPTVWLLTLTPAAVDNDRDRQ